MTLWHHSAGVWSRVYDGPFDEQPCPLDPAVPDVVARDFGLCFRPSRQAYAVVGVYLRARPRLLIQGAHGAYRKLRWQHWGKPTAAARGELDYVDNYMTLRAPVKVTLSQLRYCGHRRTYLRQKVTPLRRSDRRKLSFATGTIDLSCPEQ